MAVCWKDRGDGPLVGDSTYQNVIALEVLVLEVETPSPRRRRVNECVYSSELPHEYEKIVDRKTTNLVIADGVQLLVEDRGERFLKCSERPQWLLGSLEPRYLCEYGHLGLGAVEFRSYYRACHRKRFFFLTPGIYLPVAPVRCDVGPRPPGSSPAACLATSP